MNYFMISVPMRLAHLLCLKQLLRLPLLILTVHDMTAAAPIYLSFWYINLTKEQTIQHCDIIRKSPKYLSGIFKLFGALVSHRLKKASLHFRKHWLKKPSVDWIAALTHCLHFCGHAHTLQRTQWLHLK